MFQIAKDEVLTAERLGKIIQDFQQKDLPLLKKYRKMYKGNHKILSKQPTDTGKPCARVVVNYPYSLVHNMLGYMTGIPITYSSDLDIEPILDVLNYNDVADEDSEFLRMALQYGIAYELNYIDLDGKQRFKILDSRECFPVYDNTLEQSLVACVRYWREKLYSDSITTDQYNYYAEVYGEHDIKTYKSTEGWSSFALIDEKPHYFNQVPVTVFNLNTENEAIFDKVMGLVEAYEELVSDEFDSFKAFADAYLVLKGMVAEDKDIDDMKQKRCLLLDEEGDAFFLTKSISDTQIENMLDNLDEKIYKISNSVDFSDEKFLAQSGVAIRFKIISFENNASAIESSMRKALQKRIELIASILNLTDTTEEEIWRDITIVFTRNIPLDLLNLAQELNQFRGIVSTETLLQQIPFVDDVEAELEKLNEEKQANMAMYDFGNNQNEVEEDE